MKKSDLKYVYDDDGYLLNEPYLVLLPTGAGDGGSRRQGQRAGARGRNRGDGGPPRSEFYLLNLLGTYGKVCGGTTAT